MITRQNIARKALADLFAAAEEQRTHWYSVKEANDGALFQEVNLAFLPLSLPLSVWDELLMAVEEDAGLICKRRCVLPPLLKDSVAIILRPSLFAMNLFILSPCLEF